MLILSVFFVSLSTLAFEVLLTRVFSIGQWNHLSFMVISIALFGFGASGTFLSIVDIRASELRQRMSSDGWLFILLFFFITAVILSFMALIHLPLDYFRLPVEPIQIIYLLAAYLLLALPFFLSGLLISIAYVALPQKSGLVYFASMAGSASGAVLPIPLLPLLDEGTLIVISASLSVLPLIYSLFDQDSKNKQRLPDGRQRRILKAAGIFTLAFFISFILALKNGNLVRVAPSPYKALSQMLQFPATRILETGTGIRGRYDRVESPYIRFAPGLSLKYTGALPEQDAVFKDGDNQLVLYRSLRDPASLKFAGYMLSCSGYFLERHPENVLLILSGGGASLACAAISGANHIIAIEQSANAAEALRRQCDYHIIQQNPRAFLAQNDRGFDIIQIENWGPSLPGSAALNQEHFYTIEAFAEYLNHLNPTGVIIISRRLLLPPSDSLRMWSAGFEALRRSGAGNPEDHLAILRNFDTYTLLVSKSVLNIERVKEFASGNNFDLVFLPGLNRSMANQFHIFKNAYHFEAVNHLADHYRNGLEDVYFHRYPLDIAPQSDNRPFPGRYLKWSGIKELYRSMGSRLYALFMSGEIVVSVVFLEALLVALVLLVTPLILSTRNTRRPGIYQVIYFFAVGTGFMFVEIYFIKRIIILVGDPVISFTVVIAGILFFSCLGGIWAHKRPQRNIRSSLSLLVAVLVLETIALELAGADILRLSTTGQYAIIIMILLPPGILMGLPFPLGMRYILKTPVQRAYAWSVNGCASVLSSIIAAQLAISFGIAQIMAVAMIAYLVAIVAAKK